MNNQEDIYNRYIEELENSLITGKNTKEEEVLIQKDLEIIRKNKKIDDEIEKYRIKRLKEKEDLNNGYIVYKSVEKQIEFLDKYIPLFENGIINPFGENDEDYIEFNKTFKKVFCDEHIYIFRLFNRVHNDSSKIDDLKKFKNKLKEC